MRVSVTKGAIFDGRVLAVRNRKNATLAPIETLFDLNKVQMQAVGRNNEHFAKGVYCVVNDQAKAMPFSNQAYLILNKVQMQARLGVLLLTAGSDLIGRRKVGKSKRTKYCAADEPYK